MQWVDRADLVGSAILVAADYMMAGKKEIDDLLGAGYCRDHPELLAAFMQTASIDFAAQAIREVLRDISVAIASIIP